MAINISKCDKELHKEINKLTLKMKQQEDINERLVKKINDMYQKHIEPEEYLEKERTFDLRAILISVASGVVITIISELVIGSLKNKNTA